MILFLVVIISCYAGYLLRQFEEIENGNVVFPFVKLVICVIALAFILLLT